MSILWAFYEQDSYQPWALLSLEEPPFEVVEGSICHLCPVILDKSDLLEFLLQPPHRS